MGGAITMARLSASKTLYLNKIKFIKSLKKMYQTNTLVAEIYIVMINLRKLKTVTIDSLESKDFSA